MKIAYLGPGKTYTEKVSKELFGNSSDAEFIALGHIKQVISAVEDGTAEFGVIPIENYQNGKVIHTLDALIKQSNKAKIIIEKTIVINHCIGALQEHKEIKNIFSKDQALEQCDIYLTDKYPNAEPIAVSSTAEGVQRIVREKLLDCAAIASKEALISAGLEVLEENICPNNKTRFFVLSLNGTKPTGDDKTLIALHPPKKDESGVLYSCLSFFAMYKINLEDLLPRPDRKGAYYFFLELDGHEKDRFVKITLENLKAYLDPENKFPDAVRVFGSYPNTHWKEKNDN